MQLLFYNTLDKSRKMVQNNLCSKKGGGILREFDFENVIFHDLHIGAQKYTAERELEMHRHNFVELIYILEGTGIQEIDSKPYRVKRGDFLFVNYGQTHRCKSDPGAPLTYIEVMFDLEFISRELINKNNAFDILSLSAFEDFNLNLEDVSAPLVRFSGEERLAVEGILNNLVLELSEKKPLYKNVIHGYVEALFSKLIRKLSLTLPEELYEKQNVLEKIIRYINKNFSEDMSLEELAEKSFYNPSYFSRVFKERFGMGFKSYITKLRTEKAYNLLTSSNMSVKEIMSDCGFRDKNAIYRALEKEYGKTPSQIRGR